MPALLLGPLGKILGVAVIVLAIFAAGNWQGRKAVRQAWDAALSAQAQDAAENVIKNAENTAKLQAAYELKLRDAEARARQVREKEVIHYVTGPTPKCSVSPELEHAVDAVSRLLSHDADGVSTAPSAAREPAQPPGPLAPAAALLSGQADTARVTDAEFLLAYDHAAEQLNTLWTAYSALVQWTRSSHALANEGAGRPP